MCPPDHFDIAYEINPWMHKTIPVNRTAAVQQWNALRSIYEHMGCKTDFITAHADLPDMVFTANAGFILGNTVLPANFRYPERRAERVLFERWFGDRGFQIAPSLPGDVHFEGQGEAFLVGETIFAGYGFRADRKSGEHLEKVFGKEVISLRLVDERFYHLDTCFCPVAGERIFYYPGAFDIESQKAIQTSFSPDQCYQVGESDALDFVCNSVPINRTLITGANPGDDFRGQMDRWGYHVVSTPLDEFKKSGGGARCLTLNL